ncbi:DUF924 domain-containing protein [Georhizobium profundi]|uniref:DUF924 domain-containing protein n=1 Tax=Georhizobium profundi TaxID=2341112 RepID=A0A3Q8XN98_9HYPH|nr:DUF924 family protein [Georhizobium profundi]AZN71388.1 DUF924 domain-containing protein [Georhizobium profundi]
MSAKSAPSDEAGSMATPVDILDFWFDTLTPEDWFKKSDQTDAIIREKFAATHLSLARRILDGWRVDADARLALIIVLDQFPRNIYRETPLAFATDGLALREARRAVDAGLDKAVADDRRVFFYMPFEHSENLADQNRAVSLISALGDETYTKYAEAHRDVIVEFGRFPHRNQILGRTSTPAEQRYLEKPGSGF